MYIMNEDTNINKQGNKVIVSNLLTNEWIKTSYVYFDIVKEAIDNDGNIENLLLFLESNTQKENVIRLFNLLKKTNIIVDKSYKEKFLKNEKINVIYIMPTNSCNLTCKHCSFSSSPEKKEFLSYDKIIKIIDEIISLKTETINFTGGEPLLHKDIVKIIRYTNNNYQGRINLSSNGLLFDDYLIDSLIGMVDSIDISIDGFDEKTCSFIRGKGVYDRVINNVKRILERGFCNISLSMLNSRLTENESEKFNRLCKELGVKNLIRRFTPINRGFENRNSIIGSHYEKLDKIKEKKYLNCRVCKPGIRELLIDSKGDIYPCALLSENIFKIDNIFTKKKKLKDIMNNFTKSKVYRKIESLRPYNDVCKECSVNTFCWTCLGNYLSVKNDKVIFDECCSKKKNHLYKLLWDKY